MRRLSFAIALLLVAPLVSAQVYTWKDAQGTTHFSEAPPASGTKYSKVNVTTGDTPAVAGSAPTASGGSATSADSSQTAEADTPENRAKLCKQLQDGINTLTGSGPVVMQSSGQQQLLSTDQRKQQLDASESKYAEYCAVH